MSCFSNEGFFGQNKMSKVDITYNAFVDLSSN